MITGETKTMAEVIHEAHCLERVHNDDCMFWEDDAVSAAALSAAGYGLVAAAKREAWDEGYRALRDDLAGTPRFGTPGYKTTPNPYLPEGEQ